MEEWLSRANGTGKGNIKSKRSEAQRIIKKLSSVWIHSPDVQESKTEENMEVKQVQQSCLGDDCWELFIPD
ncbi:hypothetical protein Tco_0099278 [Tanacetum coccineum]